MSYKFCACPGPLVDIVPFKGGRNLWGIVSVRLYQGVAMECCSDLEETMTLNEAIQECLSQKRKLAI